MKAVLLSVQPRWCEKICHQIGVNADGSPIYEKGDEVRKTRPKLETPFKVYIYCTKGEYLWLDKWRVFLDGKYNRIIDKLPEWLLNSRVIGEFVCDSITEWNIDPQSKGYFITSDELALTCLTYKQLHNYGNGKTLYGWHISNLVIYDKPKELNEFERACPYNEECWKCKYYDNGSMEEPPSCNWEDFELIRPPQSWCYVEELK